MVLKELCVTIARACRICSVEPFGPTDTTTTSEANFFSFIRIYLFEGKREQKHNGKKT